MDQQIDYSQLPSFLLVLALVAVAIFALRYLNKRFPQISEIYHGGPRRTWLDEDNNEVTYNARTRTLIYK
jgi:hypothetical protein